MRSRKLKRTLAAPCGRLRSFLWDLLEYPETSKLARIIAFISVSATFMMESCFEEDINQVDDFVFVKQIDITVSNVIHIVESAAIAFFTAEY